MPANSNVRSRSAVLAENVKHALYASLTSWARELITSERYEQPEDPYRDAFADNPDDPLMHAKWHQWGIIHHTVMIGHYFEQLVPELLQEWYGEAGKKMLGLQDETIDGLSKWDLLLITVPAHDYGKFAKRQYYPPEDATSLPDFGFYGHEAESGAIVRAWADRFTQLGLTNRHVEYIARCAELHYELGKLRDKAKQSAQGYTIAFTHSAAFRKLAASIIDSAPEMKREMGVFFLADSLAKTDVHIGLKADTDKENERLFPAMQAAIQERGLPPRLLAAAQQLAVNVQTSKAYLDLVCAGRSRC